MKIGGIELDWGDGKYAFRLGVSEIDELEASADTSVFVLYGSTGTDLPFIRFKQTREVIRLGLIGGGMSPVDAMAKVARYCDERPLHESVVAANQILRAALRLPHGAQIPGEAPAAGSNGSTSPPSIQPQT